MALEYPFSFLPLLTEIISFHYETISPEDRYSVSAHLHHYHQLDVVLEGEVRVMPEGQRPYAAHSGDAWLIPPLVRHRFKSNTGFRQCSFKFLMTPQFRLSFGMQFHRFRIPRYIRAYINRTGGHCEQQAPLADQRVATALSLCLIEFLDQSSVAPPGPDHLDEFRRLLWPLLERIQNNPYQEWTVARMASQCHFSVDHFSRSFHQVLQQTPLRYLRETRMRASAAELLAVSERPIKDIAEHAGYSTVAAFSRAFKEVFKISPAAYRHTFR